MSVSSEKRSGKRTPSSSSSSDEEETRKLQSAVWNVENYSKKGATKENGTHLPSKRENLEEASTFTADFRTVDTTPEYKNFVAKKLTAYLDEILEDLEGEPKERPIKHEQPVEDSFQLFSTSSKSYVPHKINYPQPKWKREQLKRKKQGKESTSSSDSEDEKKKLEAAAVSGDFILGGAKRTSSSQQENGKNDARDSSSQVTSNQDRSILTHNAPNLDNDSVDSILDTKKKEKVKKTSREDNFDSSGNLDGKLDREMSSNDDIVYRTLKRKRKKRKEKRLSGDLSQGFENSERLGEDLIEETNSSEKNSNVVEQVQKLMVCSNPVGEHDGLVHSSNCKKKKKKKRKKERDEV